MRIEYLAWAATRNEFIEALTTTFLPNTQIPLATKTKDMDGKELTPVVLVPCAGLQIDEIGPITKVHAVYSGPMGTGELVTPAVVIEGWHANLCAYGELAEMLTAGLAQSNEDGSPKGLFERTRITALLPQLTDDAAKDGVPAGKIGPKGLKLFDPAIVNNRHRVWC